MSPELRESEREERVKMGREENEEWEEDDEEEEDLVSTFLTS
jgi:hypothetical protein